jgi:TfoX/Sxy family transcriptional regulator of competence genes
MSNMLVNYAIPCGTTIDYVSTMSGMSMPKPSEDAKSAFTHLVPSEPAVTLRPMFGNLSAFVNGNMFAGLFGEDLFVRLPDDEAEAIRKQGGRSFEPMPGHAMKGYVTVPATWRSKPSATHHFIVSALAFARTLPPKSATGKKAPGKKAPAKKTPTRR